MSEAAQRSVPYYCPYCGGEDLRPFEEEPTGAGARQPRSGWECRECTRVFTVRFIGLVVSR